MNLWFADKKGLTAPPETSCEYQGLSCKRNVRTNNEETGFSCLRVGGFAHSASMKATGLQAIKTRGFATARKQTVAPLTGVFRPENPFLRFVSILVLAFLAAVPPAFAARLNVSDFGAAGDGETNDSPAIRRALEEASEGTEVYLPPGRYRLEDELRVPPGVTLAGTWQAPHHPEHRKGTVLLGYAGHGNEDGPALIHLMPNSTVRGVTVYYPEQRIPGTVAYPWTIQGEGMHGSVIDVTLVNSYKGIDFGEYANELHYIRNVFGTPLQAGIHIDRCTDIGRIENVHFNPHYWARSGEENIPDWNDLRDYLFANCTAFAFARTDWEYVFNTFSFGCNIGYRFYESEHGSANGNFLGIAADWARTAVLVEETQPPGLLITNGEFVGGTGSEAVIDITGSHSGVVQFGNSSFWGPQEIIVRAAGSGFVSLNQCNFQNWDVNNRNLPAVLIQSGEVNVANSFFRANKKQIVLEEAVETAVITGNRFLGAERIVNKSRGDVQTGLNVVAGREDSD